MRDLYTPMRSIIEDYQSLNLNFIEIFPHSHLKQYIYSYWQLNSSSELTQSFDVEIIPNGCVSLMFNKNVSHYVYIAGFSQKAFKEHFLSSPDIFGIRFLPGQINRFFKLPFEEIYKGPIRFNRIMEKEFFEIEAQLFSASSFSDRIMVIERYLEKQLLKNEFNVNHNLLNAIHKILKSKGKIKTEDLSDELLLSNRYIRKLFKDQLGITPKELSKIIRFQNTYKSLLQLPNYKHIDIAIDNGYFDQAHLIKEFKDYSGKTPKQFIARFNT
ncbi:MAG: helix-turn-helix transcriptional regulator [Clostridia bacterium]|nr:helix-turn-helix transcriptional regulator [Clostridia bacterium]